LSDFRVVAGPHVAHRPFAAGLLHRRDDRVGRLNALRFLELPQIVPSRQQDEPVGVDHDDAADIAVVAEQQGALLPGRRIGADHFESGAFAQVA
jgi:hypothetical protein